VPDRSGWAKLLGVMSWALKLAQVGLAVSVGVSRDYIPQSLHDQADQLKHFAWLLIVIPFALVLLDWCRTKAQTPWFENAIRKLLDELQEHGFSRSEYDGSPRDHHRLTLFRHRKLCFRRWPFYGGFMVPKLRSGNLTQNVTSYFRCPDKGDDVEGIAGRAYRTGSSVVVTGLPDVSMDTASDDELKLYADKTFVKVDWLRSHRPHARSLLGIPIRINGSIAWVLVIDSRNPKADRALKKIESRYSHFSTGFVQFLENMP